MLQFIKLIDSYNRRDPAAKSRIETFFTSPGLHSIGFYKISSFLWSIKLGFFARLASYLGRLITGVEIHPAAKIGKFLFIDHGMGIVIGETAEIGNNVTLYHGVTLGGVSPSENSESQVNTKRHPTICDNVIIGSGAQILGPITIGENAKVGSNSVVTKNIDPNKSVVGNPARYTVASEKSKAEFMAYGMSGEDDSRTARVRKLEQDNEALQERLSKLEERLKDKV